MESETIQKRAVCVKCVNIGYRLDMDTNRHHEMEEKKMPSRRSDTWPSVEDGSGRVGG